LSCTVGGDPPSSVLMSSVGVNTTPSRI